MLDFGPEFVILGGKAQLRQDRDTIDACGGMWYPGDRHHAPAVPGVTRCPLGGAHSAQRQPSGWLERTARSGSKSVRVLEEMTGQGGNQQNLRSSKKPTKRLINNSKLNKYVII